MKLSSTLPTSRKYTLLLVSLVLLGLMYPVLDFGRLGRSLWTVATWVLLLGAVRACRRHPFEMSLARWMFVGLIVLTALRELAVSRRTEGLAFDDVLYRVVLVLHLVFFVWTMRVILVDVLGSGRVTHDTIYGAIALYLMMGVTGAYVFELIHEFDHAAFEQDGRELARDGSSIRSFLYLSFVTLTTLGYGDLVPRTSVARLVTSAEAVLGQLYLTILVARLVGLHLSRQRELMR